MIFVLDIAHFSRDVHVAHASALFDNEVRSDILRLGSIEVVRMQLHVKL
jgi:hypothetical protein